MKQIKKIKLDKIKTSTKKTIHKIYRWLDKPTKLKKWQLLLMAYLIFSLFAIFWPHPAKSLPNAPIIASAYLKPVETLVVPEMKPLEAIAMADYPYMPAGTYSNNYAFGNCTSLAASMVAVPNSLGNANRWDDQATIRTNIPRVGMVAQTDAGWAGHVAVVIAVGDGTVTVEEMNYTGFNMIDQRTTPISDWVYLYF